MKKITTEENGKTVRVYEGTFVKTIGDPTLEVNLSETTIECKEATGEDKLIFIDLHYQYADTCFSIPADFAEELIRCLQAAIEEIKS